MINDELRRKNFFEIFFTLFKISHENNNKTITPYVFHRLLGSKSNQWIQLEQQDAHEFLLFIITEIEKEIGEKVIFVPKYICEPNIDHNIKLYNNNPYESIINTKAIQFWINYQQNEFSPIKEMFEGLFGTNYKCNLCSDTKTTFDPFIILELSI